MHTVNSTLISTQERWVSILWKKVHDRIFGAWNKSEETRKKINKKMQVINVAYNLAKLKFEWKFRDISNEWYFEHLRETANILIESWISKNVTIYQVVVALLHDVIEDTNMTYYWLVQSLSNNISIEFAEKIATWIQGLTKNNWHDYIPSFLDKDFVKWYENVKQESKEYDLIWDEKVSEEKINKYEQIKQKAKEERDKDYLKQLEWLDDETLEVKFSDRLHNLRTQWDPNDKKKVIKKVKETKLYYLPLAKKRNTTAYNLINKEVKKLEAQLGFSVEIETQLNITKEKTEGVI